MKKLLTLVLVDNGTALLLGMKKRGFGEGRWNGLGGKLEEGESLMEAARRELTEEVGIEAGELEQVAILTFSFLSDVAQNLQVHVFRTISYSGTPFETEEMRPNWFLYEQIPFAHMWPDDEYWLPMVLEGKKVVGDFELDAPASLTHNATILKRTLKEVFEFEDGVY